MTTDPFAAKPRGPRTVYGRFVEAFEDGRVRVKDVRDPESEHIFTLTHAKSPNGVHFRGDKKVGSTDLTLLPGAIVRFDKVEATGEEGKAFFAKIASTSPAAVFFGAAPASIRLTREASGDDAALHKVTIVDRGRSKTVQTVDGFRTQVANILADDSLARDVRDRALLIRLKAADGKITTRTEFADGDEPHEAFAERVSDAYAPHVEAYLADGAKVEVTPVISVLASTVQERYGEEIVDPAALLEKDRDGKSKARYTLMNVICVPWDPSDPSKGHRVDYARPVWIITGEKRGEQLFSMTASPTPLKNAGRAATDDEADEGAAEAAE